MRDTGKDKGLPVCRPRLESDVYQAALFVYEMLTGINPFLDKLLGHQHHTHVNVMLSQLQVDGSALTPYLGQHARQASAWRPAAAAGPHNFEQSSAALHCV